MTITTPHPIPKISLRIILLTGLLVATLDILAAFVDYYINTGKNPSGVLKFIASAVIGKTAFSGGSGTIIMGLFFHYFIAFSFTFLFFWLYSRISLMRKNWIVTGIIYGVVIWTVMNFIVMPLSNTPHLPFKAVRMIKAVLILIFMIGMPLSFIAHKCFFRNSKKGK